jgi:acyl carrier protein
MIPSSQIRTAAREVVMDMIASQVADSDPLISSGLLDSLSILKLIGGIERKLSVTIPPDNLQPDDFDSIDYITETVERVIGER